MKYLKQLRANQPKLHITHWLLFFSWVGFALRLQNLSFQPLWGDEGWSFYIATQPLLQLLATTAADIHPPLYYILLKGWFFIIGIGPEEARFFSVIVGTMLIPASGILGWRLLADRRIGGVAAGLVSLMPIAIYYSQEVRMYGLVTLLSTMAVYFFMRASERPADEARHNRRWIAYITTTTAALYTMYYAAFIFLFQLVYLGCCYLKQPRHSRSKVVSSASSLLTYVILLYLPWLIYAGSRLVTYVANKREVEGYLPLNIIHFLGDHFAAFSVGHLAPHLQPYVWVSLLFVLTASVGFISTLYLSYRRCTYLYLYLFIPLLLGYVVNQIFPFNPPFFERTLLLVAPAYWLFMAAGIVWLWQRHYLLVGALGPLLLMVVTVSLIGFFNTHRYPHQDYRPLLRNIAARATPEDTVLASYEWQLGFYQAYLPAPRPQLFAAPGWGEAWAEAAGRPRLVEDVGRILQRSPRLWFPAHQALGHLWEDQAEVVMAELGYPALLEWYNPQTKLTLVGSAQNPLKKGPGANFEGRLTLLEARLGDDKYEAGRGITPVELIWQKNKSLGSEHRVSLRLADAGGRTWATRDTFPHAGQRFFTDLAPGDTLTDRHGLLIPAGTPPGLYRLLLSVRRVNDARPLDLLDAQGQPLGAELLLTEVEVIDPTPPVGAAALPVQFATDAMFGQQVRLVGYSLEHGPFEAGQPLSLDLFWEARADISDTLIVSVQLQDGSGQPVIVHDQAPVRPAGDWKQGLTLRDPHDLLLPPTLAPGHYRLLLRLITPDQNPLPVKGSDQLLLTTITTVDRPHTFDAPNPQIPLAISFGEQAKLVGLDLPETQVKAGNPLPLTLYWQAINTLDQSWTVFVHLVNHDGQIVSQQDQIPGAGQFPTTSWLPDEHLADRYSLLIPADTPPGQAAYQLEIGLYDVVDFRRLPVMESGKIINDHFVLEEWPISIE